MSDDHQPGDRQDTPTGGGTAAADHPDPQDPQDPAGAVTPMRTGDLRRDYAAVLGALAAYQAEVRRTAIQIWTAQQPNWCLPGLNRVLRDLDLDPHTPHAPEPVADRPDPAARAADPALGTAELRRLITTAVEDLAAHPGRVRRAAIEVWTDQPDWPLEELNAVLRGLHLAPHTPHWHVTVTVTGQFGRLRAGSAEHAARLVRGHLQLRLADFGQEPATMQPVDVHVTATDVRPVRRWS